MSAAKAFETLTLDTDARGVATLTLARPEKHNAMSGTMVEELNVAAERLATDPAIRLAVLTGEGRSFCAGGDLGWMQTQMTASRESRMAEAMKLARALGALNALPKPLIGRINGQAFGGGVGMMSVCDVAVAARGAKFGLTEVRLGLIPATISPYVVARMGEARARRVFFSARLFDADEALELGLVGRVVEPEALDDAVEAEIAPYLAAAPEAVAASKALVRRLGPQVDEALMQETARRLADTWETESAKEGIAAFFDKRKPAWPGLPG